MYRSFIQQVNTRFEKATNPKKMARDKQYKFKRSIVALDYNS